MVMHYKISIILFVLSSFLLLSCSKEEEKVMDPIVTAIRLDVTNLVMNAGDEHQFTVDYEPIDAPTPTYEWSFSPQDTGVTISKTGLFKSFKPGNFKVQVKTLDAMDPISNSYFISVCDVLVKPIAPIEIELSSDSIAIELGKDTLLSYTASPDYASVSNIRWKSSNENVAIVNDGKIETLNAGECIITVYLDKDPALKADCKITVLAPVLESISIDEKRTFEGIGASDRLYVTCYPENAEKTNFIWSSSDTDVAVVSQEGTILTKGAGTCIITVTTEDGRLSDSCEVNVLPVAVKNMYFTGDKEIEVGIGNVINYWSMYLHFEPENATNKNFIIEQLSGFDIATISSDGERIKGLKEGFATFMAKSEDGGFMDVCTVKVIDEVVKNVSVTIQLSSFASIAGYVTAQIKCSVYNLNEDPILVTGLDVLPSSGGGNSNSASFQYHGYVERLRSKYWLNSFNNVYEPYFLVHFQYNNKNYTIRVDQYN